MFKESFKYYKAKFPVPDLNDVLNFDNEIIEDYASLINLNLSSRISLLPGIIPINDWKCYELKNNPGLIFIKNPFTFNGQRYWISRCLQDYSKLPHPNNLKNSKIFKQFIIDNWWKSLHDENNIKFRDKLKISMRWTTLGYHHDWDTKVYDEKMKHKFPNDLSELCKFFANVLGYKNYSAEAAIINYYPIGTTLAGHTDHSESDLDAPLFSFSFGQTAIFLIGGKTKDIKPTAIYLKSGDIVIMSRESRLCYHAVPRIMKSSQESWNDKNMYHKISDDENLSDDNDPPVVKKFKCDDHHICTELWEKCLKDDFWQPFDDYIKDSRINMNVRQVLKEGQTSL